ncbi:hypothetical protein K7X08_028656 [Anisodus acutangulus]|uniref:RRM domain-containing protein n=1 Tax=Anisodus acutangulus TaxID=402998 RepID=A0A9Q1R9C6_9SOLA|nr:hypothetical protein K7X08_028656 [Anisodus acutangulus]
MVLISPSITHLYDHLFPPVSDEDFKRFHTVHRRLYGKLINVLGRDPAESMNVMAFLQWLERIGKDLSFVKMLYDIPSPLLNAVVEEALTCLKCAEVIKFTENGSRELFLIPTMSKHKFTLKYIHDNREIVIRGVTDFLKSVCLRAFDDIVQQPNFLTRRNLVPTPNVSMNKINEVGSSSGNRLVNNPSHHVPSDCGIFLESMIPSDNNIDAIGSLNSSIMMSIINPSYVFVGKSGTSNIEEIGRANRMVPMNPNHVPGAVAGGMILDSPYLVPNQMVQYMPTPILGGPAMNWLAATPYGLYSHASSSGSGVFHSQMRPLNYHHDFGDAQAPPELYKDIANLFNDNMNFNVVIEEEKEVPPDDRTVFLTFSMGYPISEIEVKEFFTRKFGEDVVAVYMQEVNDEEQALYARLVTRSPVALEAIVDGGRAMYNINGKHVWARKYVKKTNPKINFDDKPVLQLHPLQTNVSV